MSGAPSPHAGLTRRSFLKTTAAVAGAAAAVGGGTSLAAYAEDGVDAAGETKLFSGACRAACFATCYIGVKVRDGKVVGCVAGEAADPDYNRICAKGMSHPLRIYDPERIKYPIRRVGERGGGEWERISWDEAIETITSKWKEVRERYGEGSLLFCCTSSSMQGSAAYGRLAGVLHASTVPATYDHAFQYAGATMAGGTDSGEGKSIRYAKVVFIWASNVTEAQLQNWHFLIEAKLDNGAKLVVIDPNYTVAASKADIYVPIRPGTDGALAMAMTKMVIDEGWEDVDYLTNCTVAPFLVRKDNGKYLRMSDLGVEPQEGPVSPTTGKPTIVNPIVVMGADGVPGSVEDVFEPVIQGTFEVAGQEVTTAYDLLVEAVSPYTVSKASSICDIPEDTIRELTRLYATSGPAVLYHSFGADRYYNGHSCYTATLALAMVTGQIGQKGASWGTGSFAGNQANFVGMNYPEGDMPSNSVSAMVLPEVLSTGKFLGKDLQIKAMFFAGNNLLGNCPIRAQLIPALDNVELIVQADMTLNDNSKYADIVLPVPHWFEVEDIVNFGGQNPHAIFNDQAIEPLYESKCDFDIAKLLAESMGVGRFYTTKEDMLRTSLDVPALKELGIDFDTLKKNKVMRNLPEGLYLQNNKDRPYATATGRGQFYLEDAVPRVNCGQEFDPADERLPHWFEPAEIGQDNELRAKYPLQFIQEHAKWRIHTQWNRVPWLRELDPEPILKMNEKDASERGIEEGDIVKVYNDRGYVVVKASIHHGLRPGIVNLPHGWQDGQFIEGHYAELCTPKIHPYVVNTIQFDALVEVEKV
ncbi:molybdopterin-containing oxidoreductase family protein [Arabiibacter massiliensis]|uniref:molybdopterin-containing oxidoreductase family protein n=1 Tax=Arabiibacter massiliensis TaxID=1870985 RepID=UPI0009B96897|nr:molybdopterin-dependent oxidoreductase [Arabiibacter massiliensis]